MSDTLGPASLSSVVRAMKTSRRAFLGQAAFFALATDSSSADANRRVSVAEVGSIRLELEQRSIEGVLRIRVHDFRASAYGKNSVTCDLHYVADDRKETKIAVVTLRRLSSSSEIYSASWGTEHVFTHGTIAKVTYQSPELRLPISTWYALYFH